MPELLLHKILKIMRCQRGKSGICADCRLRHKNWFQADANSVTLSGNDIASFNDRKGTASKLTRADAANGATLGE